MPITLISLLKVSVAEQLTRVVENGPALRAYDSCVEDTEILTMKKFLTLFVAEVAQDVDLTKRPIRRIQDYIDQS